MGDDHQAGDRKVDRDMEFERTNWTVQRIGWIGVLFVLLAAVAGLFGPGPLSDVSLGSRDAFRLDYHRFARVQSSDGWHVVVGPAPEEEFALRISRSLLQDVTLESILPTPERMVADGDAYRLEFRRAASRQPTGVIMRFRAERAGLQRGRIGLVGGEVYEVWRWVHP